MKTYEVTITETLQKRLRLRQIPVKKLKGRLSKDGTTANISSTPIPLSGWISPQVQKSVPVIMSAEFISVGGKMFGLWDERYAIYQQASPL